MLIAMRVAVDDALDALGLGLLPQPPVKIEAVWISVQLKPGATLGAGINDGVLIDRVGIPAEKQPAGQMAYHVHLWILSSSDQPLGVVGLVAARNVQAGDDNVEFAKQFVVKIESFLEDVHLGAGE